MVRVNNWGPMTGEGEKCEDVNERLFHGYIYLCESYQDDVPIYEFGFSMIRIVSRMLFDSAPNCKAALDAIQAAVAEGLKWHEVDSVNGFCAKGRKG
jgi:hypothetical protein